jgi:hypothetical protein
MPEYIPGNMHTHSEVEPLYIVNPRRIFRHNNFRPEYAIRRPAPYTLNTPGGFSDGNAQQIDRDIVVAHLNTTRWLSYKLGAGKAVSELDVARYELAQLRAQLEATIGALHPFYQPDSAELPI